jgi:hypothetical protein
VPHRALGVALLILATAMEGGAGQMDNSEREVVIAAVTARVRSFEAVERARDPEALGSEYALASATFKREIVMEGAGTTIRQQGGVSWLWRKMGAQWLIVQGHISHPLEPAK